MVHLAAQHQFHRFYDPRAAGDRAEEIVTGVVPDHHFGLDPLGRASRGHSAPATCLGDGTVNQRYLFLVEVAQEKAVFLEALGAAHPPIFHDLPSLDTVQARRRPDPRLRRSMPHAREAAPDGVPSSGHGQAGWSPGVGNTGYVRSMYQMICPALEDFQAMEGLDASDGADIDGRTRRGVPRRSETASPSVDLPRTRGTSPDFHVAAEHGWPATTGCPCRLMGAASGAQARRAPAQAPPSALPGMMVHQDGSRHAPRPAGARPDRWTTPRAKSTRPSSSTKSVEGRFPR